MLLYYMLYSYSKLEKYVFSLYVLYVFIEKKTPD